MDVQKKKKRREDNGGVDGNREKPLKEDGAYNGSQTVTEEEVDEFFAILRRAHVAARCFGKDNGGVGRKLVPAKKRKRSQCFGLENPVETNGVRDGEREGLGIRVGLVDPGLDLNSKPETDGVGL